MEDQSHIKKKYTLENLIKTFTQHAKETDKEQKKLQKIYRESFPEEHLPNCIKEDFNVAKAFLTITKAIKELQDKSA